MRNQEEINKLLDSLSRSKFRGSFHLNNNMKKYCKEKGMNKIRQDGYEIIIKRLAKAFPKNDGKQTPMRANSHPIFIAQHRTRTCCRSCLERIHHIPKGRELTKDEIDYIVNVLMTWIKREMETNEDE